jgi:glucose/arabinose dehydrogenase
VALLVAGLLAGCGGTRSGSGLGPIGAGLRGLNGWKASVFTTGLKHASAFAFDSEGRLWVTTSAATDHRSDGVYVVARRGARPVEVAHVDGPLGLTWHRGRLYVASIGRVTAFGGLHGIRFTTRRTILRGPVEGASNNAIVATSDGRLLMSISTTCDHCVPRSTWAAAIVSFRPDGSDLRIFARRIRAAYGLALVPGSKAVFATMNQRDDLGARTPGDWLALVRRGQDWGFPACYGQRGSACARVPKPVAALDVHAAAGGIALAHASAFVAEWQTGKLLRIRLERVGGAYAGTRTTFLTGLRNPLPVARAPGGAILVGDWTTGVVYSVEPSTST